MIYRGLITAVDGSFPKIMSRITPPATPVMVERITTPTMSDLCSTALNARDCKRHSTEKIQDLDNYCNR